MNEQATFIGSELALTAVVDQIARDQWDMVMPDNFNTRVKSSPTLRDIVNYHAYDDAWVPQTLAGLSLETVGSVHDGDLLGNNPIPAWHRIVDAAIQAVREDYDPERIVHLTYGDFPASEYLRHIISFRALRAVDIARVIGVSDRLPADLAQGVWDLLSPEAETWRAMGVYGPRVPVPDGADVQAQLLGLTGRQP